MKKNLTKQFLAGLFLLFLSVPVNAQNKTILAGIVKDENTEPIPGVNIVVKNGNIVLGTISNIDGNYTIEIPDSIKSFTIHYQLVGMLTKSFSVKRDLSDNKKFIFKPIYHGKN